MADYFTHFSCLIDVGTPDNAARALALFQQCRDKDQVADDPQVAGFDLSRQDAPEGSALWIHDDDHGDIEAVIHFVLRLAEDLDLSGLWGVRICQHLLACTAWSFWRRRACHRPWQPHHDRLDQHPRVVGRSAERGGRRCLR